MPRQDGSKFLELLKPPSKKCKDNTSNDPFSRCKSVQQSSHRLLEYIALMRAQNSTLPCGRSPRHRIAVVPQPLPIATHLGRQHTCVSEILVQAHCRGNPRATSCSRCLRHSVSLGVGALRDRPIDGNVCEAVHLCLQGVRKSRSARSQGDGLPLLPTSLVSSLSPSRQLRPTVPRNMAPCAKTKSSPL